MSASTRAAHRRGHVDRADATSEEIARGFTRGRPEDVQAVSERVRRIIAFRGFGIPEDDRKDIKQEAMSQIWQTAVGPNFRASEGFWGFVDIVTTRRCIDWYRQARAHQELDEALQDARPNPLSRALAREKFELARRGMAALGEACRALIRFRIDQGMSFAEISERLGRSSGALRVQFYRCVRQAQQEINRLKGSRVVSSGRK